MRKHLAVLAAIMICTTGAANANNNITTIIPDAQKVGEGRLSYLLWDVYDAELYAPQGRWKDGQPLALKLSYLMDIDGKKIADRSAVEIREQGIANEVQLATWHTQMRNIFPDVKKGETITGILTQDAQTVFYKNNDEIGRIKDPQFSKAFFDIWLNENTTSPDLRRKLLSGNNSQMAGY